MLDGVFGVYNFVRGTCMNKIDFSDRVWCTLLWEFIQYSETKFSPATEQEDKQAAVAAFMGFLRAAMVSIRLG